MTCPEYQSGNRKLKFGALGEVNSPSWCTKLSTEPYKLCIPVAWQKEFRSIREESENDPKRAAELNTMLEEKLRLSPSPGPDVEPGLWQLDRENEITNLVFLQPLLPNEQRKTKSAENKFGIVYHPY
jgi:hypothetical protein